jgi:OmcA/MtrC family decaheme c-type cytochrome
MIGRVKLPKVGTVLPYIFRTFIFSFLLISIYGGCGGGGGGVTPTPPPTVVGNKLNIQILDAVIGPDNHPIATLKITDERGNPLQPTDLDQLRFIIARIVDSGEYIDYMTTNDNGAILPYREDDSEGTFNSQGGGVYTYTFAFMLPQGYDGSQTHTVALYGSRMVGSQRWVSNATFDFVPNGGPVKTVRDIVSVNSCNNCHDPLAVHGGRRRNPKLCITCHTSKIINPDTGQEEDLVDPVTGNSIAFKVMIHKIHMGESLPSVMDGFPYMIGNTDFSSVVFPQDIRNCTKCHDPSQASQADDYKNVLTRAACGSCHDNVDFATATNHPVVELNDNSCSGCHIPSSGNEFDISVTGAHTIPLKSKTLPGVIFDIMSVTSEETGSTTVAPGEHAQVVYSIRDNNGDVVNPQSLDRLTLTIAGPTTDYNIQDYHGTGAVPGVDNVLSESASKASDGPDANGNFVYTFQGMIPLNGTGTYAVGIEGYKSEIVGGQGQILTETVRDAGHNVVSYFAVTDPVPVPRRTVVDNNTEDQYCNTCHGEFSKDFVIHGGIRNNTQYCVLCHNPSNDDISVRPVPDWTGSSTPITTSINFRQMIHKIHTGENLTVTPYIIYGFGGSLNDFSDVLFPGQTNDCGSCHLPSTNILNPGMGILGPGILPTITRQFTKNNGTNVVLNTFSLQPVITVCTSCHDDVGVNASGDALTGLNHLGGPQPEGACINCHAAGDPLGAAEVHLIPLPFDERINRPQ